MRKAQAEQYSEGESYGRRKKPREREDERQKEKNFCERGHRRKKSNRASAEAGNRGDPELCEIHPHFSRVFHGQIILVLKVAEAREKAASRLELQERSARPDLAEFLDQQKLQR